MSKLILQLTNPTVLSEFWQNSTKNIILWLVHGFFKHQTILKRHWPSRRDEQINLNRSDTNCNKICFYKVCFPTCNRRTEMGDRLFHIVAVTTSRKQKYLNKHKILDRRRKFLNKYLSLILINTYIDFLIRKFHCVIVALFTGLIWICIKFCPK